MTSPYDPHVYDLAQSFVEDTYPERSAARKAELTATIARRMQEVIEDELKDAEDEREKNDDDGVEYGHPGDRLRGRE